MFSLDIDVLISCLPSFSQYLNQATAGDLHITKISDPQTQKADFYLYTQSV